VWQSEGNDFLHLRDEHGKLIAFVSSDATVSGFMAAPQTKNLYVDGSRVDFYVPNGSSARPFKTVMDAVNQVITNGDNASVAYCIDIGAGTYDELIVLEDPSLYTIVFWGRRVAKISQGVRSQVNNPNLNAILVGMVIGYNGVNSALNITPGATTNVAFRFCDLSVQTVNFASLGGQIQFYDSGATITSWNQSGGTTFIIRGTVYTGGLVTLTNGASFNVDRATRHQNNVTVDATSTFNLGTGCRQQGNVTVNGLFSNRLGLVTGNITVNSGGTYTEICGGHTGSFTNAGTFSQQGEFGMATAVVGGSMYSAGNVTPNGNIVGNPGDVYLNRTGGAGVTFWVKESGVGTNTGWVGK